MWLLNLHPLFNRRRFLSVELSHASSGKSSASNYYEVRKDYAIKLLWKVFTENARVVKLIVNSFHADFGKEFPSRNLWRGPSWNCPSPSPCAVPFALQNKALFGRGVANKGGKKERRMREDRSEKVNSSDAFEVRILATKTSRPRTPWEVVKSLKG